MLFIDETILIANPLDCYLVLIGVFLNVQSGYQSFSLAITTYWI